MNKLLTGFASAALVLALSACGAANQSASGTNTQAAADANVQQVKITASNWKFDQAEYKVKKGQPVTITLDLQQGMHSAEIKEFNVRLDSNKKSLTFTPDKAGTFEIRCMIPCGEGHANMASKLVVE